MSDIEIEQLSLVDGFDDFFQGTFNYGELDLQVCISLGGESFENARKFAKEVLAILSDLEKKAKEAAGQSLLDIYNESWREYSEPDGEGGFRDVSRPVISSAEFESSLTLEGVSIDGAEGIILGFDDGDLFAGHTVEVTSLDGLSFSELDASFSG